MALHPLGAKAEPPDPIIVQSVALSDSRGLERKNPELAVVALEMLASGSGFREIELKTGVGFAQLMGLRTRHEAAIEVRRKQLANDGFEIAEGLRLLTKEKMNQMAADPKQMQKANLRDLVISWGIAQDKGLVAAEGNRSIVEHVSRRPSLADAAAAIEEARKALQKEAIQI